MKQDASDCVFPGFSMTVLSKNSLCKDVMLQNFHLSIPRVSSNSLTNGKITMTHGLE